MAWNQHLTSLARSIELNHFGIELPNIEEFDKMAKHLSRYNGITAAKNSSDLSSKTVLIHDSDGIRIQIYHN